MVGNGKIFICSVDEAYDIVSGESGDKSISDQDLNHPNLWFIARD